MENHCDEFRRGDFGPNNKLKAQGVRNRDVTTARLAAFAAERAGGQQWRRRVPLLRAPENLY
jgi:hypothetical protein